MDGDAFEELYYEKVSMIVENHAARPLKSIGELGDAVAGSDGGRKFRGRNTRTR